MPLHNQNDYVHVYFHMLGQETHACHPKVIQLGPKVQEKSLTFTLHVVLPLPAPWLGDWRRSPCRRLKKKNASRQCQSLMETGEPFPNNVLRPPNLKFIFGFGHISNKFVAPWIAGGMILKLNRLIYNNYVDPRW